MVGKKKETRKLLKLRKVPKLLTEEEGTEILGKDAPTSLLKQTCNKVMDFFFPFLAGILCSIKRNVTRKQSDEA